MLEIKEVGDENGTSKTCHRHIPSSICAINIKSMLRTIVYVGDIVKNWEMLVTKMTKLVTDISKTVT